MNSNFFTFGIVVMTALLSTPGSADAKESRPISIASPDGTLTAVFRLTPSGEPRYLIQRDGWPVLGESRLGLIRGARQISVPTST